MFKQTYSSDRSVKNSATHAEPKKERFKSYEAIRKIVLEGDSETIPIQDAKAPNLKTVKEFKFSIV